MASSGWCLLSCHPSTRFKPAYVNSQQATYTSDGTVISEPISYLRHWSRGALELLVGIMGQMDPRILPRIDADKFLSSISGVIDGERIRAPAWDLGPGWKGDDVEIGKRYTGISDLDAESLVRLWNSDNKETPFPFNKPQLLEARDRWTAHVEEQMRSIPVCALMDEDVRERGRFMSKRKGAMQRARNNKTHDDMEDEEPDTNTNKTGLPSGALAKQLAGVQLF